uniref:L-amino acid transporter, LAT family n=1 Tax=Schistosoma japonicum TaxID=6182 RepID=C1L428_SCHJA|nr:L-amino acid transporter, LAT family [Schistosoma japonicum]
MSENKKSDDGDITVVVDNPDEVKLKRSIGLLTSITIIVGSMIGSGIFVSPTGILKNVQSIGASLVIWVACGIFSMLGAYCYAELGTMIERSGGDYVYVYEAFGPFVGFLRLWVEVMVVRPGSIAIIALTFAEYVVQPIYPDCDLPIVLIKILAGLCITFLSFVNSFSIKFSTRIQDIFTFAKLAALLIIIITGIVQIALGRYDELKEPFVDSNWSPGLIANAFYSGLFAYSGWNYLNCVIEEMKNPRKHLPIAIVVSCILVTVTYTVVNVAYVTVVPVAEILKTRAVAVTFSKKMYGVMWWIMPIFVACSTFGGVNGTVLTTSRIFFVASQLNQMPSFISYLQMDRITPIPAVLFTCIISVIYLLPGDIETLINYTGFVQILATGICVLIVVIFRFTRSKLPRPVKAPLIFAIIYIAVTLFLLIFAFVGSYYTAIYGVAIIVTGIPFYLLGCAWDPKPKSFQKKMINFTVGIQKLFRVVPSS